MKRVQYVMKGAVCDEACITVFEEREREPERGIDYVMKSRV